MHQLKKFVKYDDFKVALDVFAKETFTIWSLVDSLYTDETKTQYKRATFKCVHYKKEEAIKSKGNCIRPNQHYSAKGCEAIIKVNLKANENVYEVRQFNVNYNHETNEELFKMYTQTRKLNEAEEQEAWKLIQAGGDAKKIAELMFTNTGKMFDAKQIHNIQTKYQHERNNKATDEIMRS